MKNQLFIIYILFLSCCLNKINAQSCVPNSIIKASLCPDSVCCPCPLGVDCYPRVAACDTGLIVVGFKMIFNSSSNFENNEETVNEGNTLSLKSKSLLNKAKAGDKIEFNCVRARNSFGEILVLEPFTITLKNKD